MHDAASNELRPSPRSCRTPRSALGRAPPGTRPRPPCVGRHRRQKNGRPGCDAGMGMINASGRPCLTHPRAPARSARQPPRQLRERGCWSDRPLEAWEGYRSRRQRGTPQPTENAGCVRHRIRGRGCLAGRWARWPRWYAAVVQSAQAQDPISGRSGGPTRLDNGAERAESGNDKRGRDHGRRRGRT